MQQQTNNTNESIISDCGDDIKTTIQNDKIEIEIEKSTFSAISDIDSNNTVTATTTTTTTTTSTNSTTTNINLIGLTNIRGSSNDNGGNTSLTSSSSGLNLIGLSNIRSSSNSDTSPNSPSLSSTKQVKYFPLTPHLGNLDRVKKVQDLGNSDEMNDETISKMFDDDKSFLITTPEKSLAHLQEQHLKHHLNNSNGSQQSSDPMSSSGEVEFLNLSFSDDDSSDSDIDSSNRIPSPIVNFSQIKHQPSLTSSSSSITTLPTVPTTTPTEPTTPGTKPIESTPTDIKVENDSKQPPQQIIEQPSVEIKSITAETTVSSTTVVNTIPQAPPPPKDKEVQEQDDKKLNYVRKLIKKVKFKSSKLEEVYEKRNGGSGSATTKEKIVINPSSIPDNEYYKNLMEYLKEEEDFKPSKMPKESPLDDGHLFILYGDLTKLVSDVKMVPCSHNVLFKDTCISWLKPDWMSFPYELRNKFKDTRIDFRDGKDRVYKVKEWPTEYPNISQPWLCNVVPFRRGIDSTNCAWYVKGAIDFLDKVGEDLLLNKPPIKNGRAKPLVSLPILGTGGGGGSRIAGQILSLLIHELFVATRKWKYDVVLVTNEISMYTAAKNIRKELMDTNPTFSSIYRNLLGPDIIKKAHSLAKMLEEGKLAIFIGAGASRSAGLPTWTGLLHMLGAKLDMTEDEIQMMEQLHHLDRATVLESRWKRALKQYSPDNLKSTATSNTSDTTTTTTNTTCTEDSTYLNNISLFDFEPDVASKTKPQPTTTATTTTTTTNANSTTADNITPSPILSSIEKVIKRWGSQSSSTSTSTLERSNSSNNFESIHKKIYSQINVPMQTEIANLMKVSHAGLPHFLLASTPVKEIVTTNYDQCFEIASKAIGNECRVLPYHSLGGRDKRWILKLHGCVSNPQDIIITREDYLRYGDKNEALSGIVQALLITKHLLFVGFSLLDDNFYQVMSAVKRATTNDETSGGHRKNKFGTALFLQKNQLMNEIWGQQLDLLCFDENKSDIAWCARKQEIFLEYLTGICNNNTSHLMEKRFDCLLKEGEKIFRDRISDFVTTLPNEAKASDAYKKFQDFLIEIGYDPRCF